MLRSEKEGSLRQGLSGASSDSSVFQVRVFRLSDGFLRSRDIKDWPSRNSSLYLRPLIYNAQA